MNENAVQSTTRFAISKEWSCFRNGNRLIVNSQLVEAAL